VLGGLEPVLEINWFGTDAGDWFCKTDSIAQTGFYTLLTVVSLGIVLFRQRLKGFRTSFNHCLTGASHITHQCGSKVTELE
jgi:hypothetical protein